MKNKKNVIFLSVLALLFFSGSLQTEIKAQQISVIKVYPSTLRIEKGKSKTLTAVAFTSSGTYVQNQNFNFVSNNTNIITVAKSREGVMWNPPTYFSKNLADVRTAGIAGTTTVYASLNGINSNAVTVLVDDPAATPTAVIHGDNDASGGASITAKVGEPIEINAESSQGVSTIEWNWGDGDKTTDLLSATHAYLQAGTYTLQLTVKNSSGTTATSTVAVNVQNHVPCDGSNTINVNSVSALQTAYNNLTSAGGKCILLAPGIYDGNLSLQPKNFSEYVTIGTTAALPGTRNRITPDSSALVIIRSSTRGVEALNINNGIPGGNKAGKLRFVGIKFDPKHDDWTTDIDVYYIVKVGDYETTNNVAHNPEKVIFQHCVLNPPNNIEVAHGLLNNGYKVSIISSWLGNIKTRNAGDSQAVFGLSGRGSHVYNNNFLEAGSENIIYGGTGCITNGCTIDGIVPTNIEMRRNFFTKRLSWRTDYAYGEISVKNLFETKTGRRIYAEGNLMTNHWDDYENQAHALVFKSAVGSGAGGYLWNVTEDVVFENNRISHIQGGIATVRDVDSGEITGYNPLKVSNIRFKNNVFDDAAVERFGAPQGKAWFIFAQGVDDLILDHVTMIDPRDNVAENGERAIYLDDINNYRLKITNSIIALNQYGFSSTCGGGSAALTFGGGGGIPDPCVAALSQSWIVSTNVFPKIADHNINSYPSNNSYPENYSGVGLANYVRCDSNTESCNQPLSNFECVGGLCNNAGSDGQDRGAIISALAPRIACSESGIGTNCSSLFDFDGDRRADISLFRPSEGKWYLQRSKDGFAAINFGVSIDIITPADFDGDGRTDLAVYRPSNGTWYLQQSSFGFAAVQFGLTNDIPVQADYDADGKADVAIFRPSNGTWHYLRSSDGGYVVIQFGQNGDKPAIGDYDGDGKSDLAVFRPSNSVWYIQNSSNGSISYVSFGVSTDQITPADYDGDKKTDVAVYRPSTGTWYLQQSSFGFAAVQFGLTNDIPAPADYDDDGKADVAVFRPSTGIWHLLKSTEGYTAQGFGLNGDMPIPSTYVR